MSVPDRSKLVLLPDRRADRQGEHVVAAIRDGEIAATIYGTREGIQVCSDRFGENGQDLRWFFMGGIPSPSMIVSLLAPGEQCPQCGGSGFLALQTRTPCPICTDRQRFVFIDMGKDKSGV